MDPRKIVLRETGVVALGQAICIGAMFGIFALLDKFDATVLFGGLLGGGMAILNFFVMAVCVNLAADKAEAQNVKGGKALIQISMLARYAVIAIVFYAGAKSGKCSLISLLLPLVFVRPTLTLGDFFRKTGEAKS